MGVLDTLGNLIGTIPASYVSGSVNVTMSQSLIPINVVASILFLKIKYQWTHYLGVFIVSMRLIFQITRYILIGILVDVIPLFESSNSGNNDWFWVLLLFIAYIPQAASNVYKERYLKADVRKNSFFNPILHFIENPRDFL